MGNDSASSSAYDRELVRRMHQGDERALGALYDHWATLVHSVAAHLTDDTEDAREVVEETFWQAWCQCDRYDPARGTVVTWLTMMARARALDRRRSRGRRREDSWLSVPLLGQREVGEAGSPLVAAENAERGGLVRQAVAALPEEQRRVIELAYFRGMSQSEIAEFTGHPLGTVKTRVRLAMDKLKQTLSVLREIQS